MTYFDIQIIPPTAVQMVTSAEIGLRVKMPDDFKEYLIELESWITKLINEDVISDVTDILSRYPFPMGHDYEKHMILDIFGVSNIWGMYQISKQIPYVNRTEPYTLLPFADNGCGDYFCLSVGDNKYGAVYRWHHEFPEDDEGKLLLLSDSFGAFLSKLERRRTE